MAKELVLPAAEEPPRADAPTDTARTRGDAQPALIVFGAVEVVAFFVYLVIGHDLWFWSDEWDFLAGRGLNVHDLLEPHSGHLVALPLVVYRAMYFVFGVRSYVPYEVLIIVLHLVAAGLLRAVMRRAGVGPWIATVAASMFVFFGAGGNNILWGFQITLVGALVFGLGQLLLADHDGPVDRRDWLGLAAGFLAILCSGVGVTMVAVVGLAALARRGWRAALLHTVPLGVVYGAWWLAKDRGQRIESQRVKLFDWDRRGLTGTFGALGHFSLMGWVLAALFVAGLVLAWRQRHGRRMLRTSAVMPLALLAGAFLFLTLTGVARSFAGVENSTSSRYLYVVAALMLPALAVAADALARRSRALAAVVIVILLVGIPGNIGATRSTFPATFFSRSEREIRTLPGLALARKVPGSLHPDPNTAPEVTVSWLLDAASSGRLRVIHDLTPVEVATNTLRLSLSESNGVAGPTCARLLTPIERDLGPGESFTVRGTVDVQLQTDDGVLSDWVLYGVAFETGPGAHVLTNAGGTPLRLHVRQDARPPLHPASVCD